MYLPRVAAVYAGGSQSAGKTQNTSGKFITDTSGDHGAIDSPIYAPFDQCRSEWQHILAQAATNTYDACDAINKAIDNFSQTDTDAGDDLNKILDGKGYDGHKPLHDPDNPASNPVSDTNHDHRYDKPDKDHKPVEPYDGYQSEGDQGVPDYNHDGKVDDADRKHLLDQANATPQ
ncbi:MAG TPA: hypothetical protein VE172_16640 [Stackebrandtia sp.]|uniref:hypothetical protein n=1 Tax=Stackebrandtia sp. TaxID=2023065 RepID=UPI002D24BCBE|nr:hypothetical protein [Stackebrandtia sp.]HZE40431.1 hypothetical protein [Stackebrandtia sp.]